MIRNPDSGNQRFLLEWSILILALLCLGSLIVYSLRYDYRRVDANEHDRL